MNASLDPSAERPPKPEPASLNPVRFAAALAWAMVVASGGGYLCGLMISRFGELGSVSLYALGWIAGLVAYRIYGGKNLAVGWVLVAACVVAGVFAEVCWIHWSWPFEDGQEAWRAAISLLPKFVQQYSISAFVAGLCTALGAHSAFRHAAQRYRVVRIIEE